MWEIETMRFRLTLGAIALALILAPSFAQNPNWVNSQGSPPTPPPSGSLLEDLYRKNGKGTVGDVEIRLGESGAADGKVVGLNPTTFAKVREIKRQNPNGTFTQDNASALVLAILSDNAIDNGEMDLLNEMTQSQFRGITVTLAGDDASKVIVHPTSGNAKKLLQEAISPPLSLDFAWSQGAAGWNKIAKAYKRGPIEGARVLSFVAGKLEREWGKADKANAYKPFRDLITQMYGYSSAPGADVNTGRAILYKASKMLDDKVAGAVPDFLYNWTKPGGTL